MGKLKILLTLFVVLVITSVVNQSVVKNNSENKEPEKKVAGEEVSPTPTLSPSPTKIPLDDSVASPTQEPKPTTTQTPSSYVYPGATIQSSANGALVLVSSDDPGKITDWYVAQIQNAGFNAKSTVLTNTNGKVLNKISATGANIEIAIEIKRDNNSSSTEIRVSN